MTALLFNHLGREVLTTSWSVAENDDATVNLWYAWGQGNSLMTLPVSMPVLRSRITESPTICDLRHLT